MIAPGVVLIVAGMGIAVVAWAAAAGRLKRNWIAGLRLRSTMRSDSAWLAAHRKARVPFLATGTVMVIGGILLAISSRAETESIALGTAALAVTLALVAGYQGSRAAGRVP